MAVLYLILLIVAAICFGVAAFAHNRPTRVDLVAAGLLAWVLVPLIQAVLGLD